MRSSPGVLGLVAMTDERRARMIFVGDDWAESHHDSM